METWQPKFMRDVARLRVAQARTQLDFQGAQLSVQVGALRRAIVPFAQSILVYARSVIAYARASSRVDA